MKLTRDDGFVLDSTGYPGYAGEILALRNANRSEARSMDYLDWRYASAPGAPAPRIFWLRQPDGRAVGMAAAVFRPFWARGSRTYAGVLGDISIDASLRGRGLGRALLDYMTAELDRDDPEGMYCAIPTEAAKRILLAAGWKPLDGLVAHVLPLNPAHLLQRHSPALAALIAKPLGKSLAWLALRRRRRGYSLLPAEASDASIERFWQDFDKSRSVMSDRGAESLAWRYTKHPNQELRISILQLDGRVRGYVVYGFDGLGRECSILDFLLQDAGDLGCLLGLVVETVMKTSSAQSIRIVLNRGNTYRRQLWKLGFIPRDVSATFLLRAAGSERLPGASAWHLTQGDKDI